MLSERLYLVKNNVPWDVAWNFEPDEVIAHMVIMAGFDGHVWNWRNREFEKPGPDEGE